MFRQKGKFVMHNSPPCEGIKKIRLILNQLKYIFTSGSGFSGKRDKIEFPIMKVY